MRLLQNNDIALSAIHGALDEKTFEQIKNIEMAHEAWKKLEESSHRGATLGPPVNSS